MKQEDKELLLKDLCARLPYKPIVHAKWSYRETNGTIKHKETDRKLEINDFYAIWDVKPYLRLMSNMTEEEQVELGRLIGAASYNMLKGNMSHLDALLVHIYKNHIDAFGLIEKGLAIEVTKENNPYENDI